MKYVCPLVTVTSIDRARRFYEDLLEQRVKFDFGENVTFHGDFAIHQEAHFSQLLDGRQVSRGGNGMELYFEHDDVDGLYQRLYDNGVVFVHGVREQPWRQRVIRFYDPDGNLIEVGESLEHLSFRLAREGFSFDRIAEVTGLSLEFVRNVMAQFDAMGE